MQKVRLFFLFSLFFSATLCAQTDGTLKGSVKNSEGVPFGTVRAQQGTQLIDSTVTGIDGEFVFRFLKPGVYTLVVTGTGIDTTTLHGVRILSNRYTFLDIFAQPSYGAPKSVVNIWVQGKITNAQSGVPVTNARVVVRSTNPGTFVQTDKYGEFHLQLPEGSCLLRAELPGFRTELLPLVTCIGSVSEVVFRLQPTLPWNDNPGREDFLALPRKAQDAPEQTSLMPIDTLHITAIKKASKDSAASALLQTGRLYCVNDSTYYFASGDCPQYVVYRKRGELLKQVAATTTAPMEFVFRKTRNGWMIGSAAGVKARVE